MTQADPEQPTAAEPGQTDPQPGSELEAWREWWVALTTSAALFAQLAGTEVQLAASDLRRLLILGLLLLPLLLMTWLSLCAVLCWGLFVYSGSVSLTLGGLLALHLLTLGLLRRQLRKYGRSLTLPRTRTHLKDFLEDLQRGTQTPGS